MATAAEVERAIRSLAQNIAAAEADASAIPDRSILCVLPDLDAAYFVELRAGKLQGLRAADTTEQTDARITARSDDLIALIERRLSVATAFLMGRVRIDAAPADLMRLRKLF